MDPIVRMRFELESMRQTIVRAFPIARDELDSRIKAAFEALDLEAMIAAEVERVMRDEVRSLVRTRAMAEVENRARRLVDRAWRVDQ
jgi:cell division GTPase FtsZ